VAADPQRALVQLLDFVAQPVPGADRRMRGAAVGANPAPGLQTDPPLVDQAAPGQHIGLTSAAKTPKPARESSSVRVRTVPDSPRANSARPRQTVPVGRTALALSRGLATTVSVG